MSFTAVTQNAWKFQPDVENKSGNLCTVHEHHPRSCHRARGRLYPKQVTSSVAGITHGSLWKPRVPMQTQGRTFEVKPGLSELAISTTV